MLQNAREKEKTELVAKREKLMVDLEVLGRRIEEFSQYSELSRMQQVQLLVLSDDPETRCVLLLLCYAKLTGCF